MRCYPQVMDIGDLNQALHVMGSGPIAGALAVALKLNSDQILINEDLIFVGPAPATTDLDLWRTTRQRFVGDLFNVPPGTSFNVYAENGLLMHAERLGEKDIVIVWIARDLPEQLLLAWVVFLFDHLELDLSKLRVVQFENLLQRQRVLTVGELSLENIQEFCPEPRQLNSEEADALRRAWQVYTSSDPSDLSQYAAEASPMPLLHQALCQLVYRYPDQQSGIGVWDAKLLHYTAEIGPKAARIIGSTMVYAETLDHVGDTYLFRRLTALAYANLASPLISITGNARIIRGCEVKLTPFGEKVLAGEANHVEVNGIDDWVGGVHLSSAEGNVTFRDDGALVLP